MAGARIPGVATGDGSRTPAITPGPMGVNDQADPNRWARLGDTPGTVGVFDRGDPSLLHPRFGSSDLEQGRVQLVAALSLGDAVAAPVTVRKRAPWMDIAEEQARKFAGQTEDVIEKTTNYQTEVGTGLKTLVGGSNAWCAAFVNYCLRAAGYPIENASFADRVAAKGRANAFYQVAGPKPKKGEAPHAMVRNPLYVQLDKPVFGAIAMVTAASGHGHHVGFVYSMPSTGEVVLLGGNQSDRIRFSTFHVDAVPATTRMVKGKPVKIKGHPDHLLFFVPATYADFAKGDTVIGNETDRALNTKFGITVGAGGDTTR